MRIKMSSKLGLAISKLSVNVLNKMQLDEKLAYFNLCHEQIGTFLLVEKVFSEKNHPSL